MMTELTAADRTTASRGVARPRRGRVARRPGNRLPASAPYAGAHGRGRGCDPETPYRMRRWERLAMTLIVAAALVVGGLTVAGPWRGDPTVTVTVGPGESLLSVALRALPGSDPGAAVETIERLNGLTGPQVPIGAVLLVPAAH